MRMLVAGAAGFIGYHLSRRLLDDGHEVVGVDSFTTGQIANRDALATHKAFTFIEQDIANPLDVDGPLEMIYNLACPASPVDFRDKAIEIMRTCSIGLANLLDLAHENQAVLLQASTSECYGDPLTHPQSEDYWGNVNPIGPRAPYDEGKRFGEALCMSYHRKLGLRTRLVRIFNTYGPRMRSDDGRALPNFINQALRGQPLTIHGDGSQTRSFCYVTDLVDGIIRTANCDHPEPINIGNDAEITVRQAAEEVIRLTGDRSSLTFVDRPRDDPERRRPNLAKARRLLGWAPKIPREEGFAETVSYFRSLMT
jgi:dTDP-glucose 4,6-dehydratase